MTQPNMSAQSNPKYELSRSLKGRHLTMISIGGIIGAGLFVSSGTSIIAGGPASFISYLITGLLVLLEMRMLGEMTTALPHVRSFTEFARAGLGEGAGFVVGWLYWYFWVLVVPVTAPPTPPRYSQASMSMSNSRLMPSRSTGAAPSPLLSS